MPTGKVIPLRCFVIHGTKRIWSHILDKEIADPPLPLTPYPNTTWLPQMQEMLFFRAAEAGATSPRPANNARENHKLADSDEELKEEGE